MTETTDDSDIPPGGAGWCCAVILRNAPQMDDALREMVENTFYYALLQQFPDIEAAFMCYDAWTQDKNSPAAQEWVAATMAARIPVHQGLALANAPDILFDGDNCAYFEVSFIYDVD